jgi:hypothetical protein
MPQYFEKYIKQVDDVELSQAFNDNIKQINDLDAGYWQLDAKRYAPGKWTVKESLQHVIDWERVLSYRALLFARQTVQLGKAWMVICLPRGMNADRRAIDDLIDELRIARQSTKAMFESFDAKTLQNTGTNWKYEISVLAMGFTIIGHQIHHLKIIEDKYYPLLDEPR